ncbi:hypothetical protein CRENBAI_010746 [Crenichthys baileyi]|uniref:HpcH/HpaI aldolase/citrate lyase domain-containing protein n=1 Tax=Crenichthys baileyi TaxID=28760 RepID=A0AAV9S1Q5_9TELE
MLMVQAEARETVARMLGELDLGRTEKCVRVNSVSSGLAEADLHIVLQANVLPPAIMLPKVEDIQQVKWYLDLCISSDAICLALTVPLGFNEGRAAVPPCVTDRPYWAVTGVNPPSHTHSFVRGQFSHRFGAMHILCPPHYLVCTGDQRIAPCPAPPPPPLLLLPSPPLIPFLRFPSPPFSSPVSPSSFHDCKSKIVRGLVCIVDLNGKKSGAITCFPSVGSKPLARPAAMSAGFPNNGATFTETAGVVNESNLRRCPCAQFVDRFQHNLKGRTLTEPIRLVTFVETAVGLLNFKAVCEELRQLAPRAGLHHDGVVFGSDDFCASIGATRTSDARELLYARQKVVVTTKAFGLQAIDLVYIDYKDVEGLRLQAREGALMGFTGKQVIHPGQIQAVQEEFSPSPDRVQWAEELIAAFDQHQKEGKGAFTFRGSMIDLPSLKQAQNILILSAAVSKT